ncbi:GAF domain-containing protein [Candidatus Bathyarchaeota archaeon]|nr:GAF domain-containing protein [Candidatus Bathyarchaeota archaeon]
MEHNAKEKVYSEVFNIIKKEVKGKSFEERMALVCSVLKAKIPYYFWVGFYIPKKDWLELGPSRGPPACAIIAYTGVCGKCAKSGKTIIVSNVHEFPEHITCDPRSKSEIAVPVFNEKGNVVAVLDVDSEKYGSFDEKDREWLERISKLLTSP